MNPDELPEWKPLRANGPAIPGWQVSRSGTFRAPPGVKPKCRPDRRGRLRIDVPINGETRNLSVARLVLASHWNVPLSAPVRIGYIDGDRSNPACGNLRILWRWDDRRFRRWLRKKRRRERLESL